jgi:bifunctional non-homologous end joining protein LigD
MHRAERNGSDLKIPSLSPLRQHTTPFDDPDWIYEIKHDGFRALAVIQYGQCRFFSRKQQQLHGFGALGDALVKEVKARTAILDGELVVADHLGRTVFASMRKRDRRRIRYFAFDLLGLNGKDLRALTLLRRKRSLKRIVPAHSAHILYVDHTVGAGRWLYRCVCELDLEGIVAKHGASPYQDSPSVHNWIKIKNPRYSQMEGRGEWFDRLRKRSGAAR